MSDKYITRAKTIAARMLGGEMMIMSAPDSTLFTLNEQATAIWNAADGITPLREIVERHICSEYEVEPEAAYADAEELVTQLAGHGILIVAEAAS